MANYYVHGNSGSDANSGLTPAAPKLTMTAAIALMDASSTDTLHVAGTFREYCVLGVKSNKTIRQWVGQTQAEFRGDVAVTGAWTHIGSNVYTHATGVSPEGMVYNHANSIQSGGWRFNTMKKLASAAAVTSAASGGDGYWNVTAGTITAYFGGDNPNTSGKEVGTVTPAGLSLFMWTGGTGNTIDGLWFSNTHTNTGGYGVRMEDNQNSVIRNCVFWGMGSHAAGFLGYTVRNAGNRFESNIAYDCDLGGTQFVFYNTAALGSTSGLRGTSNRVYSMPYRNITGTAAVAGGNTQVGYYCHDDGGTSVTDVEWINCDWQWVMSGGGVMTPFGCDNVPAVAAADYESETAYPVRVYGGTCSVITGYAEGFSTSFNVMAAPTRGIMYRGTRFWMLEDTLANAGSPDRGVLTFGFNADPARAQAMLFISCEVIGHLGAAGAYKRIIGYNPANTGGDRITFINCSFYDLSPNAATNFHAMVDNGGATARWHTFRRCIFEHKTAGTAAALCTNDAGLSAANHVFDNCVYKNIDDANARWSQNTAIDTAAEWVANVDANRVNGDGQTLFPLAANSSLAIAGGYLASLTAVSGTNPPSIGIDNVPYNKRYGCYQDARPNRIVPPPLRRQIKRNDGRRVPAGAGMRRR